MNLNRETIKFARVLHGKIVYPINKVVFILSYANVVQMYENLKWMDFFTDA